MYWNKSVYEDEQTQPNKSKLYFFGELGNSLPIIINTFEIKIDDGFTFKCLGPSLAHIRAFS